MSTSTPGMDRYQWEYGKLRSSHTWVAWVMLAAGILALPVAWLLRNELGIGRAPLPPWTVVLVGTVIAMTGFTVSIALFRGRRQPAALITIDKGQLTLPGGILTGSSWSVPVSEVKIRTTDLGFVKQMQVSGPRKRTTLSSALFRDDDEFERLFDTLSNDGSRDSVAHHAES